MKNNRNKIGILYVIGQSEYIGGAEKESLYIINNLDRRKFRPTVILPKHGPVEKLFRASHIHVKVIGQSRSKIFKKTVSELIIAYKINIIHLVTLREFEFKVAAAARINRIPCVWHMHFVYKNVYPHTSNIQLKRILACVCLLSEKVIACSNYVRRQFEELGLGDKVVTILNGVDFGFLKNSSDLQRKKLRKKLGIKANDFFVTMAGRFLPQKRHADFIDAAKIVNRAFPDVKFIAEGSFADKRYLSQLLERAEGRVVINGFKKNISSLINAADLIVMPSIGEGFGLAVLEAMSCAKAVVAVRSGGIPEIVTDKTAILVSPKAPEKMAAAIIKLARNRNMAGKFGKQGRKRSEKLFDIKLAVKRLQELYLEIYRDSFYFRRRKSCFAGE